MMNCTETHCPDFTGMTIFQTQEDGSVDIVQADEQVLVWTGVLNDAKTAAVLQDKYLLLGPCLSGHGILHAVRKDVATV